VDSVKRFPAAPASAGAARRWVCSALESAGLAGLVDQDALLVGEPIGNVVLHARCEPDVRLSITNQRVIVEVRDTSTVLPTRKR
jgi:hypothetical protein